MIGINIYIIHIKQHVSIAIAIAIAIAIGSWTIIISAMNKEERGQA